MARQSIQDGYFDAPLAAFPGQVADFGTANDNYIRQFPAESAVVGGRGVVKATLVDSNQYGQNAPYRVAPPTAATVAADFVGVVVRTEAMTNVAEEAAYPANAMASVTHPQAGGALIHVKAPVAITDGDPVFMSIDETQSPNLPAGEFTNAAGAGVIAIVKLRWRGAIAAGEVGTVEHV